MVHKQVLGSSWRRFWDTIFFGPNYKGRKYTLFYILLFGLVGSVFMDWDHFFIREFNRIRPLHIEIWVISILLCGYFCTSVHRRIYNFMLRNNFINGDGAKK